MKEKLTDTIIEKLKEGPQLTRVSEIKTNSLSTLLSESESSSHIMSIIVPIKCDFADTPLIAQSYEAGKYRILGLVIGDAQLGHNSVAVSTFIAPQAYSEVVMAGKQFIPIYEKKGERT